MKDEKKKETKASGDAASTQRLFRRIKMPTLTDTRRGYRGGAGRSVSSNNKSSFPIASEKKEKEESALNPSSSSDKISNNNRTAVSSTTTSSMRRHDGVLCYQVHMEFPIPQKLWTSCSSSRARQAMNSISTGSHCFRLRQLCQCKSWMIQTATRAMWQYLLYSRGILPVPVHEILRSPHHDQQHHDDVAASNDSNKNEGSNMNNHKINIKENQKLQKTREALQQLDQDWSRLASFLPNHIQHHGLEIVQVMIVLGSSWRRPKEVHLLDFGSTISSDDDVVGLAKRIDTNTSESPKIQDENDGTAAILDSMQHGLSSRLIRTAMQAEGEAMMSHGTTATNIGPADQVTIIINVTATSYNEMYQKAQQEQREEQQPCKDGLVLSSSSSALLLQSLTLCRDFDLHEKVFAVSKPTPTATTGILTAAAKKPRPILPSLVRCSKTFLKLSLVGPVPVAAGATTGDDEQQQAGAGENDNVLWLSLAATVKGFSLAK
jgi:hypothetical protein